MNAGDLRHKIYIVQNENVGETDENGNPIENWKPITEYPFFAAKKGLRGRLFYEDMAAHAEDVVLFVIRYSSKSAEITTAMRICEGAIVVGGITTYKHTYEIVAPPVDPADNRKWFEIRAREVKQNGG